MFGIAIATVSDSQVASNPLGIAVAVLAGIYFGTRLVMRQLSVAAPARGARPT